MPATHRGIPDDEVALPPHDHRDIDLCRRSTFGPATIRNTNPLVIPLVGDSGSTSVRSGHQHVGAPPGTDCTLYEALAVLPSGAVAVTDIVQLPGPLNR